MAMAFATASPLRGRHAVLAVFAAAASATLLLPFATATGLRPSRELLRAASSGRRGRGPAQAQPRPLCGSATAAQDAGPPQQRWYCEQQLDHFAPLESSTWPQRYFINDTFFGSRGSRETSPVFLCVGGEGGMTAESVVSGDIHCGDMMLLAAEHGALVVSLEHRYYGASFPVEDLSTKNLRWLSSQQALADIAQFHEYMTRAHSLSSTNRWVAFGGSYPGMMAAWSRLKYPHLISAAVASSAPVQASLEMRGYFDVVGNAIALESIGGSLECRSAVRQSFAHVGQLLETVLGRSHLVREFKVCDSNLTDLDDQTAFIESLSGSVYSQENDPASQDPSSNVAIACKRFFVNASLGPPIARLSSYLKVLQSGDCLNSNSKQSLQMFANRSRDSEASAAVSWTYQTCSQFGYYQTCDPGSHCPYTSKPWLDNLNSYLKICETEFGISAAMARRAVAFSNADTGGWRPQGSRVLWMNGEADPWHALSVLRSLPGMPAVLVPGASHHFWTHPPKPTDPPSIVQAREVIREHVGRWLREAPPGAASAEGIESHQAASTSWETIFA